MDEKPSSDTEETLDSNDTLEQLIPVDEVIEEEIAESGRKVHRRGVYLLPNLLTTAGLFAGFYAIVASL